MLYPIEDEFQSFNNTISMFSNPNLLQFDIFHAFHELQVEVTKTVCDEFKAANVKFLLFVLKCEYRDVGICLLPKKQSNKFWRLCHFCRSVSWWEWMIQIDCSNFVQGNPNSLPIEWRVMHHVVFKVGAKIPYITNSTMNVLNSRLILHDT